MRQVNNRHQKKQAGFTLIELMVVVVIIGLLVGFGGWNYLQYGRQSSVESAARELRMFLTEAKNNARYGKFSSNPNSPCYVGDLTWTTDVLKSSGPDQRALRGHGNYLEMVGSAGIVLENWAVYFDTRDPTRTTLWMQVYCKHKTKGSDIYMYPQVPTAFAPLDDKLREKTWDFQSGIVIKKPRNPVNNTDPNKHGIEFVPLYLSVRYPIDSVTGRVYFGPSCFGEGTDEIVIGDTDGRYLYKMKVGLGGDVSKGCFCQGSAEQYIDTCVDGVQAGDEWAPCGKCR